jgi:hypothetical protein
LANSLANSTEALYASEVIAHVERLLVEMFSGNESLVPKTMWDHYDVVDGIYTRSWPSFDKYKLNFAKKEISLVSWPRVGPEETLYFIQRAGVQFHFSSKVWGLQQGLLEGLIRTANGGALTKSRVLEQASHVLETMFSEWRVVILRALELDITIAKEALPPGLGPRHQDPRRPLKEALKIMRDNPDILRKKYSPSFNLR